MFVEGREWLLGSNAANAVRVGFLSEPRLGGDQIKRARKVLHIKHVSASGQEAPSVTIS